MSPLDPDSESQGLLSVETLASLQLRQQPFTKAPADGDLFVDQASSDLLADINEALISGDDVLLIMGPNGAGKSTLMNQLSASSNSRITCFSVKGSGRFSANTLFAGMLDAFKCEAPDDLKLALDELIPNLQALTDRYNRLSTIVIDDADQVPEAELTKLLSSLLYINSHDEKLLRVLLAAEPEFEEKIPEVLPEGADLPYASLTIEPFDAIRSKAYLEFRLNQAGYFEEFPFSDKEIITMHEESDGFPKGLHVAAAAALNESHGDFEGGLPPELLADNSKGSGGKLLKYVVGGAACLMIGAGALSFLRNDGPIKDDERYKVVETRKIETSTDASTELASNNTTINTPSTTAVVLDTSTDSTTVNSDASNTSTDTSEPDTDAVADTTSTDTSESDTTNSTVPETDTGTTDTADATETPATPVTDATDTAASENSEPATTVEAPATEPAPETVTETVEPDTGTSGENANDTETAAADTPTTEPDTDASLEVPEPTAAPAGSKIESPNWILVQGEDKFTVQMSASKDRKSLEDFLLRSQLQPPNSIFSYTRNGGVWFALVHGLFDSIEDARTAVNAMPASARRDKPWVRKVGSIQSSLKAGN